jgi:hypothetical protein
VRGTRRDPHLRGQRVLGRILGPVFLLAGAFMLLAPLLAVSSSENAGRLGPDHVG